MSPRVQVLLLLLAVVAVFAPDPAAQFVWDDVELIGNNAFVTDWANLPTFFAVDLWHGVPGEHAPTFYRPLMQVELLLDHTLFGLKPAAYQVHSLLWHLLASGLVFEVLRRRFPHGALAGAALFALHPLQAEVTRFVAARNDTMALAGVLGAWLLARRPVASSVLLLLALLSKEIAVLGVVGFILWERAVPDRKLMVGWAAALGVYLLLRMGADLTSVSLTLEGVPRAAVYYAGCLVSPLYCNPALSPQAVHLQTPALLSVTLLSAALARRGAWGLVLAALALAPAALAAGMSEGLGHRYLLFTIFGLAWALAASLEPMRRGWLAWLLVPVLAFGSRQMLPRWATTSGLWSEANGLHSSLRSRCGVYKAMEAEDGDADTMGFYLLLALPEPHCCYNASRFWLDRGDPVKAVSLGREALVRGCAPEPNLLAPLAVAEAMQGDWEAAVEHAGDGRDPYGYGPVVLSAAALREGDRSVLEAWQGQGEGDLEAQVRFLLEQAGEPSP